MLHALKHKIHIDVHREAKFLIPSKQYEFLPPTNEVWGKVKFLHLSVILFTGGSTWAGSPPGRYTPWQVHPLAGTPPGRYPLAGTPPWQVHPLAGTPPAGTPPNACWDTVKQAVHILLECILIYTYLYSPFAPS